MCWTDWSRFYQMIKTSQASSYLRPPRNGNHTRQMSPRNKKLSSLGSPTKQLRTGNNTNYNIQPFWKEFGWPYRSGGTHRVHRVECRNSVVSDVFLLQPLRWPHLSQRTAACCQEFHSPPHHQQHQTSLMWNVFHWLTALRWVLAIVDKVLHPREKRLAPGHFYAVL